MLNPFFNLNPTFALVNIPSDDSQIPDKNKFLTPNLNYLQKFALGDLGISELLIQTQFLKYLNSSTKSQSKILIKSSPFIVNKIDKISSSDLKMKPCNCGMKSFEKSIIQTIFESQKPYMDIIKIFISSMAKIEDVICRYYVLVSFQSYLIQFSSMGPFAFPAAILKANSMKPQFNRKAMGYIDNTNNLNNLKSILKNLESIRNSSLSKNSSPINGTNSIIETESIAYSTGNYDPSYTYIYEYITINNANLSLGTFSEPNSDKLFKIPDKIIIDIFDYKGNIILNDNNIPSWIKNNKNWYGTFDLMSNNPQDDLKDYQDLIKDNISLNTNDTNSVYDKIDKSSFISMLEKMSKYGYLNIMNKDPLKGKNCFKFKRYQNGWINPESDYKIKILKILPNVIYNNKPISEFSINIDSINPNEYYNYNTLTVYRNISVYDIYPNYGKNIYSSKGNNEVYLEQIFINKWIKENTHYVAVGNLVSVIESTSTVSDKKFYHFPDFINIFSPFSNLLIDIITKLIPSIEKYLEIIQNPLSFITTIMEKKLGDDFGSADTKFEIFATDLIKKLNKLNTLEKNKRQEFINLSNLMKYVYLDKDLNIHIITDGGASISFFGLTLTLTMKNGLFSFSISGFPDLSAFNTSTKESDNVPNIYPKGNTNSITENDNVNINNNSKIQTEKIVNIQYSTGEYIPGYNYTYIYQTQYVTDLINKAKEYRDKGDIETALNLVDEALKKDPKNKINIDLFNELFALSKFYNQPVIKFLLSAITFPFKIIQKIVSYIMSVFQKITNPLTLVPTLQDFLTFKWILQFFDYVFLLEMMGIKFDIVKYYKWIEEIEKADEDMLYDMNDIINIVFLPKLPIYTKKQFENLILGFDGKSPNFAPIYLLKQILCLIESIINSFIDFVWNLIGISSIIPPPHINLCKKVNNPTFSDIMGIINGNFKYTGEQYDFSYDISLSTGIQINDLDSIALKRWIDENRNWIVEFK